VVCQQVTTKVVRQQLELREMEMTQLRQQEQLVLVVLLTEQMEQ
jgi:hypothetical protein